MNIPLEIANKEFQKRREENKKKNKKIQPDKDKGLRTTEQKIEGATLRETTPDKSAALTKKLNIEGKKGKGPENSAMDKYGDQLKALLKNKEKLVGTKVEGDNRNKYQIQINKLKKRMKADGMKFNSLLNDVKKQEREGKFDRGEEGKTKNKLRAKMQSEKIGGSRGR